MTETAATSVILEEAEVYRLHAEYERLSIQRDAADARMAEINRTLVTSGEARLARNKALASAGAQTAGPDAETGENR